MCVCVCVCMCVCVHVCVHACMSVGKGEICAGLSSEKTSWVIKSRVLTNQDASSLVITCEGMLCIGLI